MAEPNFRSKHVAACLGFRSYCRKLLAQSLPAPDAGISSLSGQPTDQAWEQLHRLFDETYGGFGDAPKFLHPAELQFCLRRYIADHNTQAPHVVVPHLEKMARGGLYDQLGGGFCRYSTYRFWQIPHFEKMLYDAAPVRRCLARD